MLVHVPGADQGERHRFVRHYVEMVVAMIAGMAVFGMLLSVVLFMTDHRDFLTAHGAVRATVMATNMTAGMAIWMRHRGHSWGAIADMAAAMYAPLAILLIPYWLGVLSATVLLVGMHVLMFVAMWIVMLRRQDEYVAHHIRG